MLTMNNKNRLQQTKETSVAEVNQYEEIMEKVEKEWKKTSDLLEKQKSGTLNLLGIHLSDYFRGLIDAAEILNNRSVTNDLIILQAFIFTRFQY